MPSPRNGTVSNDIPKAIKDALRGVTEIKPDRSASIRTGIGKMSFTDEQLFDNLKEFVVCSLSFLTFIKIFDLLDHVELHQTSDCKELC